MFTLTHIAQSAMELVSMLIKIRLAVNVCVRNVEEVAGTPTRTNHARSSRDINDECLRCYLSVYKILKQCLSPTSSTPVDFYKNFTSIINSFLSTPLIIDFYITRIMFVINIYIFNKFLFKNVDLRVSFTHEN